MASYFPSPEKLEPENAVEHSDLGLCVISGQGELRCRDPPIVVNREKEGAPSVFVTFVALPEEVWLYDMASIDQEDDIALQAFRLFVCNYGSYDVGADVSFGGEYLGKWLIACEPQAWHHVACDSLFQFHKLYGVCRSPLPTLTPLIERTIDRQSKVFEPTTIEIRFQHLHKTEEGSQQASLVPVVQRQPSPEDGPGYVRLVSVSFLFGLVAPYCVGDCVDMSCSCRPRSDVMQSAFATLEDDQFLTFLILFYPPVSATTFPPLQTTPISSPEPSPRSYHAKFLLFTKFHLVLTFSISSSNYSFADFFGNWFNKELGFYLPGLYIFAPVSVRELTHIVGTLCLMAPFLGKDVR